MATQIIRQQETRAIPGVPRMNREGVGEIFSAVGEVLRLHIGTPFGLRAEEKPTESISPMEKAVIDAFRLGVPLF